MATITVKNLSDEDHRALQVRAAKHRRSAEAEARAILEQTVKSEGRIKLGSLLAEIGRTAVLADQELAGFKRDQAPSKPVKFA